MKKSKIEQWLVYVSLMPWGTFPGSKDRLSKEKNNFITGKYWDHNYAVYGLIWKSYITKKKKKKKPSAKRMCKGQRSTAMPWESTALLSMNCF